MALGAFLAGVLLADSEYRHELEADIEPFKGLLLGLFFIAVGMSANLGPARSHSPGPLSALVGRPACSSRFVAVFAIGRGFGQFAPSSRAAWRSSCRRRRRVRVRAVRAGSAYRIIDPHSRTCSSSSSRSRWSLEPAAACRCTRPCSAAVAHRQHARVRPRSRSSDSRASSSRASAASARSSAASCARAHLSSRRSSSVAQVDFVRRFGNKVYYGDASRLELLRRPAPSRPKSSCSRSTTSKRRCALPRWCATISRI